VLTARGFVAWIAQNTETAEVWRYDRRGGKRLARGADIDRFFLKRRCHAIEWRQGGVVHRASLRP
jgi:hypothetical protein